MDNVFLKPARDATGNVMVVPDPETHRQLAETGEWKPMTSYWVRRIRDMDVIPSEPPKSEKIEREAIESKPIESEAAKPVTEPRRRSMFAAAASRDEDPA